MNKELKSQYDELGLSQETVDLLHSYFSAFANLYGILSLDDAYKIINKQNPGLISFDELYEFSNIVMQESHYYFIINRNEFWYDEPDDPKNREIVAQHLLSVDEDDYYELSEGQAGKPLYIPKKEELLRYEDELYYEKTPQAKAVENFLMNLPLDKESYDIVDLMAELTIPINIFDNPIEEAFSCFNRWNIVLSTEEAESFIQIYRNFLNNFRIHYNRGYTPKEIGKKFPQSDKPAKITLTENTKNFIKNSDMSLDEMLSGLIEMDMPSETKLDLMSQISEIRGIKQVPKDIPKNAPCPCGSGKKYKRCCGKDK